MNAIPKNLFNKLKALNYPRLPLESISLDEFCLILVWLEEEYLRSLEIYDRTGLRDTSNKFIWYQNVKKYYQNYNRGLNELDLNCPEHRIQIVNKLLSDAICLTYQDQIEEDTIKTDTKYQKEKYFADNTSGFENFKTQLNEALSRYQLPLINSRSSTSELCSALKALTWLISEDSDKSSITSKDLNPISNQKLQNTQALSFILRSLHGESLSEFQSTINGFINDLQKIISHSKTITR